MGQFYLLLKRNFLQRRRQPVLQLLEFLWPLALLTILLVVRRASPPTQHGSCRYRERLLPSSGVIPFLQSFICNLQNECEGGTPASNASRALHGVPGDDGELVTAFTRRDSEQITELLMDVDKWASGEDAVGTLQVLPKGLSVLKSLHHELARPEIQSVLQSGLLVRSFFRDPDDLANEVSTRYLSKRSTDVILNSSLSVTQLYSLSTSMEETQVLAPQSLSQNISQRRHFDPTNHHGKQIGHHCDSKKLLRLLSIPDSSDKYQLVHELCKLKPEQLHQLSALLHSHLDVANLLNKAATFATVLHESEAASSLRSMAAMIDVIKRVDNKQHLQGLPSVLSNTARVADWLLSLKPLWRGMADEKHRHNLKSLAGLIEKLSPVVNAVGGAKQRRFWHQLQRATKSIAGLFTVVETLLTQPPDVHVKMADFFVQPDMIQTLLDSIFYETVERTIFKVEEEESAGHNRSKPLPAEMKKIVKRNVVGVAASDVLESKLKFDTVSSSVQFT